MARFFDDDGFEGSGVRISPSNLLGPYGPVETRFAVTMTPSSLSESSMTVVSLSSGFLLRDDELRDAELGFDDGAGVFERARLAAGFSRFFASSMGVTVSSSKTNHCSRLQIHMMAVREMSIASGPEEERPTLHRRFARHCIIIASDISVSQDLV